MKKEKYERSLPCRDWKDEEIENTTFLVVVVIGSFESRYVKLLFLIN